MCYYLIIFIVWQLEIGKWSFKECTETISNFSAKVTEGGSRFLFMIKKGGVANYFGKTYTMYHWIYINLFIDINMFDKTFKLMLAMIFIITEMEEQVMITEVLEIIPQQGFECAICKKSYKLNGSLQRHLQCHFDGKQFQCLCGKSFSQNYLLKRHQKTHDEAN